MTRSAWKLGTLSLDLLKRVPHASRAVVHSLDSGVLLCLKASGGHASANASALRSLACTSLAPVWRVRPELRHSVSMGGSFDFSVHSLAQWSLIEPPVPEYHFNRQPR